MTASSFKLEVQEEESIEHFLQTDNFNQRLFVIENLRNNELKLSSDDNSGIFSEISRCINCGFPLSKHGVKRTESRIDSNTSGTICYICKRVKVLNSILIFSYFFNAAIFIASFIAVLLRLLSFDFSLMIGCIQIIFLLFFGRFLEEAVYFGIPKEQRPIAALYQFATSGDMQGYDIAYRYLQKTDLHHLSSEFYSSIYHILLVQTENTPYYFFEDISSLLGVSIDNLLEKIIDEVSNTHHYHYLEKIFEKAQPMGISFAVRLYLTTNQERILHSLTSRISKEVAKEKPDNKWLKEFFINEELYLEVVDSLKDNDLNEKVKGHLQIYSPPKVPTIDVIQGSKKLLNNPLARYLIRIAIFIALAFIIGLIYQLINIL